MSETKVTIDRMDPTWAMFAAAVAKCLISRDIEMKVTNTAPGTARIASDYADAMLRERDRRNKEDWS